MAPDGAAEFQCARYLAPDEKPERAEVEAQLEAKLDATQPGWRACVVSKTLLLDVRVASRIRSGVWLENSSPCGKSPSIWSPWRLLQSPKRKSCTRLSAKELAVYCMLVAGNG